MKKFLAVMFSFFAFTLIASSFQKAYAYDSFGGGCKSCHGKFTDTTSPRGTLTTNKHDMHRNLMLTDVSASNDRCYVCHVSIGDGTKMKSSKGNSSLPGFGCLGCHGNDYGGTNKGAGLRKHHAANGITSCAGCHAGDPTPVAESVNPPYYGKAGVNITDALNRDGSEDFTGDGIGLDNDGNNLYDTADPAAFSVTKPLKGGSVPTGKNFTITWTAFSGAATYKVSFSIDGGLTWTVITPSATGTSAIWAVPNTFTQNKPNSMIMVQAYNASSALIGTAKSGKFTITVLKFTAPALNAIVPKSTVYNVTWIKNGTATAPASAVVQYSSNNGVSWTAASGTVAANKLSFAWNVPAAATTTAKLKVTLKNASNAVIATAVSPVFKVQ